MQTAAGTAWPERRVTVLCDNTAGRPDLGAEWGLSLALDLGPGDGGGLWLWDTGQSGLFLKNAALLGVDVTRARGLALSHGHYDHTGGIDALFAAGFAGRVHAHPACAWERYAEEPDGRPRRPIGPPHPLPGIVAVDKTARLAPGLTMLADIPRLPGRFQAVGQFSRDLAGTTPDPTPDDAFLVLETASGPVAVLGCCHSGLANSLACARQRLGIESFHAVLGGLHLFAAGETAVRETAEALREFRVERLVAGHCSGRDRVASLRGLVPDCEVHDLSAGQTWIF